MLVLVRLLAVALLLALPAGRALAQSAETRVALVIGNASYDSVPALANAGRDAESMASVLRKMGFTTVIARANLTREAFLTALRDFSELAAQADWAVVYFGGHGIEVNGVNYMIPIDARLMSDRDIAFEAIALDQLLHAVDGARKLRLIILDACRDNPFATRLIRSTPTRQVSRGLARVEPQGGTLVAYAARDGQVALDGADGNSPFVSAILRHIETPGLEVNKLFRLVRNDVLISSRNQQEPFVYGALPPDDFFFVMPRAADQGGTMSAVQHLPPSPGAVPGGTPGSGPSSPSSSASDGPVQPPPAPAGQTTPQPPAPLQPGRVASLTDPTDLVRQIQGELRRLGCYEGEPDGAWDGAATRKARQALTRSASVTATAPDADLLDSLRQRSGRLCPPSCKATETVRNGRCVAKTCRKGEILSRTGACIKPVAKVQPQRDGPRRTPPAPAGADAPTNCFVFDGRRYCQ